MLESKKLRCILIFCGCAKRKSPMFDDDHDAANVATFDARRKFHVPKRVANEKAAVPHNFIVASVVGSREFIVNSLSKVLKVGEASCA